MSSPAPDILMASNDSNHVGGVVDLSIFTAAVVYPPLDFLSVFVDMDAVVSSQYLLGVLEGALVI